MTTGPVAPGVAYTLGPPPGVAASITKAVQDAIAQVPADRSGAILGVATERGMNLVIAQRVNSHLQVTAWVGKSGWDQPTTGGAAVRVVW